MMALPQKHFLALLVWCLLLGAIYLAIDAAGSPKVVSPATGTEIRIPRSADGHFYLSGRINGLAVDFLVDTGATTVSVGEDTAARIGLPQGRPVTVGTANGSITAAESAGHTLSIGSLTVRDVRVITLPRHRGPALLGQNVLRHLDVTQMSDVMVLRARSSTPG